MYYMVVLDKSQVSYLLSGLGRSRCAKLKKKLEHYWNNDATANISSLITLINYFDRNGVASCNVTAGHLRLFILGRSSKRNNFLARGGIYRSFGIIRTKPNK